jgi:fructokinase
MPSQRAGPPTVTVVGEAIIDLLPAGGAGAYVAMPGGSPYNVAVGLSRLGLNTALMARLGDTAFGRLLRDRAAAEGIDLSAAPKPAQPATLAVVSLDSVARASYDFYLDGTADWHWSEEEIDRMPARTELLHFGSLASWTPPGDELVAGLARRLRDRSDVLVSYDPNIRPGLLAQGARARQLVERNVGLAHLVKASADDIAWLYPEKRPTDVASHWLDLGAEVVILTDGPAGAGAWSRTYLPVHRPAHEVVLADTVGAGDSFTSALLGWLVRHGPHAPDDLARCTGDDLSAALDEAILAAELTCQRPGADPPTAAELAVASGLRRPAAPDLAPQHRRARLVVWSRPTLRARPKPARRVSRAQALIVRRPGAAARAAQWRGRGAGRRRSLRK